MATNEDTSFQGDVDCNNLTVRGTLYADEASIGSIAPPYSPPYPVAAVTVTINARPWGSDAMGDGSLANPYATFQRAGRDVPLSIPPDTRYVIDITDVTEVLPQDYTLPPWSVPDSVSGIAPDFAAPFITARNGVMVVATPRLVPLVPASDATINLADVASNVPDPVTGLRTVTLAVPRASWGVNALKGKFVIDAANNTANAVIYENTASAISITTNQTLTFPLQIMEPSATLTGSALRKGTIAAINIGSIGFNGIRISTPGQQGLYMDTPGYATLVLCELDSVGAPPQFGSLLPMRSDFVHACWFRGKCHFASYRTVFFRNTFLDACTGIDFRSLLTFESCKALFFTRTVFDGCQAIAPVNHVTTTLRNGNAATVEWWWFDHCLVRNCPNTQAAIFFSGAYATFFLNDIYANAGSGILCSAGAGTLHLDTCRTSGAPNGNFGVEVRHGMRVLATAGTFAAPPGTELRGAAGDMKVGGLVTRLWSDFAAAIPPSGSPSQNEFDVTSAAATGATGTGSQIIASTP